jgi:hypothetical protein
MKATLNLSFKYKNVPVKGIVRLQSGEASQAACSSGNNVTTCSITPNKSYIFSLGYISPAKKAARCSPANVIGVPVPGAKYAFDVNCM